jgi:transposase
MEAILAADNGVSGQAIIEAILKGERNPLKLAGMVNRRVKATQTEMAKALVGDYRDEHLFQLRIAFELYHRYESKIAACDKVLTEELAKLPDRVKETASPLPPLSGNKRLPEVLRQTLQAKLGVDLTAVEGFGPIVALTVLSEAGPDLSRFKTEKHFTFWLGLCPDNRISGGKVLSCRTRRVVNRLTDVLRLAATTLEHSPTALGAYHRRMKAKLGGAAGITATAHKLARILYALLTQGEAYVRQGLADYEQKHRERKLKQLQITADAMGFKLIQIQDVPQLVS